MTMMLRAPQESSFYENTWWSFVVLTLSVLSFTSGQRCDFETECDWLSVSGGDGGRDGGRDGGIDGGKVTKFAVTTTEELGQEGPNKSNKGELLF
jgi:hypothetical protein